VGGTSILKLFLVPPIKIVSIKPAIFFASLGARVTHRHGQVLQHRCEIQQKRTKPVPKASKMRSIPEIQVPVGFLVVKLLTSNYGHRKTTRIYMDL
jgi:hypothetical protein